MQYITLVGLKGVIYKVYMYVHICVNSMVLQSDFSSVHTPKCPSMGPSTNPSLILIHGHEDATVALQKLIQADLADQQNNPGGINCHCGVGGPPLFFTLLSMAYIQLRMARQQTIKIIEISVTQALVERVERSHLALVLRSS